MTPEEYAAMRDSAVAHLKGQEVPEVFDKLRALFGPIIYAQYEAQLHEYLFDAAMDLLSRGVDEVGAVVDDIASNRVAAITALVGRHLHQYN